MNIRDKQNNKDYKIKKPQTRLKSVSPRVTEPQIRPERPNLKSYNPSAPQIISGYFIEDKSYKELVANKINTALALIIGVLVLFCMATYYFVITCEIDLNKMGKETLALNYDNEELQAELDRKQSYSNIDKAVSAKNNLKRANQILEVTANDNIAYSKSKSSDKTKHTAWTLGY